MQRRNTQVLHQPHGVPGDRRRDRTGTSPPCPWHCHCLHLCSHCLSRRRWSVHCLNHELPLPSFCACTDRCCVVCDRSGRGGAGAGGGRGRVRGLRPVEQLRLLRVLTAAIPAEIPAAAVSSQGESWLYSCSPCREPCCSCKLPLFSGCLAPPAGGAATLLRAAPSLRRLLKGREGSGRMTAVYTGRSGRWGRSWRWPTGSIAS